MAVKIRVRHRQQESSGPRATRGCRACVRCSIRADPRDAIDTAAARPLREAQHLFPRDLAAVGRAVYRLVDPAAHAQSRTVRKRSHPGDFPSRQRGIPPRAHAAGVRARAGGRGIGARHDPRPRAGAVASVMDRVTAQARASGRLERSAKGATGILGRVSLAVETGCTYRVHVNRPCRCVGWCSDGPVLACIRAPDACRNGRGFLSLQCNIEKVDVPLADGPSTCGNVAHFLLRPLHAWPRPIARQGACRPFCKVMRCSVPRMRPKAEDQIQSDAVTVAFPNDSRQLM